MLRRRASLFALALLLAPLLSARAGAAPAALDVAPAVRLVRVPLDQQVTLTSLLEAGLDIVEVRGGREAKLFVRDGDEATLTALGARIEVLDENPGATAARAAAREIAQRPRPKASSVRSAIQPDGRYRIESLPPFGSGSMGGYWTLDEVKMKLDSLVASDLNDLVADKIDTLGTSRQGRPIWGLEISRHVTGPDTRPWIVYNALTHAREPGGMQSLFYFVDDLLSGYGTDPWKTYLLEKRRIYICPVVNPDGYQINVNTYVSSGGTSFGMWRKNARDNNGNLVFDSGDGVDVNRNYGYQWGFNSVGSSGTPSSDIYRGPSAFSEPETQAQRNKVVAVQPKSALSFHTYSDLWLHPWGWQVPATADSSAFYEWDDEATRGVGYMAGQSTRVLYEVNGEFNDWCYGETVLKPRLYGWTPEAGGPDDGFWPPPSRILPIAQDNLRGCYFVAALAGPYVRVDKADWTGGSLVVGGYGNVLVTARNLGLANTAAGLNATLVSLDPGAEVLSGALPFPTLASRVSGAATGNATFLVGTADTLTPGRMLRFRVEFRDNAGLYCRDTLEIPAGVPTYLLNEPSNNFTSWVIGGNWNIVSNDTRHPSKYFADSPFGVYVSDMNAPFTMKGRLNLSTGLHAWAFFDARWSFEGDYDGCMVEASLDSVTWTPLAGRSTTPGTIAPQPAGLPIYESERYNWKGDYVDLSRFCGPTATQVRFRFRSVSDSGTEFDGMSFDSLRIAFYDPAAQPTPVAVGPALLGAFGLATPSPNPARGFVSFAWTLPEAGRARLEVLDLAGRRVATLADGIYGAKRYARGWDLHDDRGGRIAPGIYFARLTSSRGVRMQRLVVLE